MIGCFTPSLYDRVFAFSLYDTVFVSSLYDRVFVFSPLHLENELFYIL